MRASKTHGNIAEHTYHLTRVSTNKKTGGIAVGTTSKSTCPKRCRLKGSGCYADSGPLAIHWNKVSRGERGSNLTDFCTQIRSLPKFSLWRYAQAGDLPGDGHTICTDSMDLLVHANRGRKGFTYTHYDPTIPTNADAIRQANEQGFTVNLSAETLAEADQYAALGVAPVVVLLPADQDASLKTPEGRHVIVCPAAITNTTCAICAICANADRRTIVGFPSHGTGKAKAQVMFFQPRG